MRFQQKFNFLAKTVKFISASGALPPNPRLRLAASSPDPRVVTAAYYYNFVEFISILAQNAFYHPQKGAK